MTAGFPRTSSFGLALVLKDVVGKVVWEGSLKVLAGKGRRECFEVIVAVMVVGLEMGREEISVI